MGSKSSVSAHQEFFRSRWVEPPEGVEVLDPERLAPGFRASGVACGIKPGGGRDLGLVVCDRADGRSAAVFTANAAAAAPVRLCRERSDLRGLRAIVVNSGNANAGTGNRGLDDAAWMQGAAAQAVGCGHASVGVASTGVIGVALPMRDIGRGIVSGAGELRAEGGGDFAEAIMTTDSGPKTCTISCDGVTLSAQAKGAGMIQPGFATLLAFFQTDALVEDPAAALRSAAEASFGRITVDGQMSTNDSVFLQTTGESGRPLPAGMLEAVSLQLALDVLADGEGATRVARVSVTEAADSPEAERVARAIANSQLVQTALFGRDPNFGRIVQAAGMALAGEDWSPTEADVTADELGGERDEVELGVRLGRGEATAAVFCSDLTHEYVRINAEYTT